MAAAGILAKRCDVFIIGSGLAGSTFARILVDNGARVLMADAETAPAGSEGHSADYPNAMVSYAVGGMAVHWTCAIPEFQGSCDAEHNVNLH